MDTKSTVLHDRKKPKSYYIFTMKSEIQLPRTQKERERESKTTFKAKPVKLIQIKGLVRLYFDRPL